MADYAVRVTGSETDISAYRQELLAELKAQGLPENAIEISPPKPARRKLTESAPLGHIEWIEIVVKIAVGVLTPVITELIKQVMQRRAKANSVEAREVPAADKAAATQG